MSNRITSLTSPKIKKVVSLRKPRQRKESGLTIIEGRREIERALEAKINFTEIYIQDDSKISISSFKKLNIPVYLVPQNVFEKISYGDRSEGILGLCHVPNTHLNSLPKKKIPFFVIVEGVEKPGNLGAILRTCDGAGVDGVVVADGQTDLYNPNVIRSSLGTIFSVKTVLATNDDVLQFLKDRHIHICAAIVSSKTIYTKHNFNQSLAIVLGSEAEGLTDFWTKNTDTKLKIPMKGKADSLNVSVSTAILVYEALRQRG